MTEVQGADAPDPDQPLLVADGLGKSYGRLTACESISFSLYSGEVLAIVGLFNSTNAIADGYQIEPDVRPPQE